MTIEESFKKAATLIDECVEKYLDGHYAQLIARAVDIDQAQEEMDNLASQLPPWRAKMLEQIRHFMLTFDEQPEHRES